MKDQILFRNVLRFVGSNAGRVLQSGKDWDRRQSKSYRITGKYFTSQIQ